MLSAYFETKEVASAVIGILTQRNNYHLDEADYSIVKFKNPTTDSDKLEYLLGRLQKDHHIKLVADIMSEYEARFSD